MMTLYWAVVVLVAATVPAHAGPVAAAFTAAAGWVGSTLAAGGIGAALLRTGIGFAASRLIQAVAGTPAERRNPGGIKTDVEQTGGTNPQSFILGWCATNGTRVCPPMSRGEDNRFLSYVINLMDLPATALTGVWVDGTRVEFEDGDGGLREAKGDLREIVRLKFHDGRQTSADGYLLDQYGDYPERPWRADMVLRGCAYAIMVFKYDREKITGWPKMRFELEGAALYDPRRDSSVGGDGSQRWSDPATWAFTTNPQVMKYNVLRGITLPDGNVWGVGADAEDLPLDNWFAAMNVCDERVDDGKGGTEPRYRAGLEIRVDEEPWTVIVDLDATCGGDTVEVGGRFYTAVGEPEAPVYYLTDEDTLITEPRDYAPFPGLSDTYNAVSAKHPDPRSGWESTTAVPLYNPEWEAEDGGRRLVASLDLMAMPYPRQGRAVMRELAKDNRRHRTHVLPLPPNALGFRPLQTASWTSGFNWYEDKLFEATQTTLDPETLCTTATLRERDPKDYNPDAAFDAVQPTPPSRDLVIPTYVGIPGWDVYPVVIRDNAGVPRRVGIAMQWDPEIPADAISWEITVVGNGDVVDADATSDIRQGGVVRTANGIIPAVTFSVRGRMIGAKNSLWTAPVQVTTEGIGLGAADLDKAFLDALERAEQVRTDLREQFEAADQELFTRIDNDLDGVVSSIAATYATLDGLAGLRTEVLSRQDGTEASIDDFRAAQTSLEEAVATLDQTVTAGVADAKATAGTAATAVADLKGNLAGIYSIKVTSSSGGVASADYVATVDGSGAPFSRIRWRADQFQFAGTLDAFGLSVRTLDIIRNALSDNVFATRAEEIGGYESDYRSYLGVSYSDDPNVRYDAYVYATVYGGLIGVNIALDEDSNVNERLKIQVNDKGDGENFDNGTVIRSFTNLSGSHAFRIVGKRAGFSSDASPKILNASIIVQIVKQGEK